MTELFKCLALLSAVSVVHGFTDVRDDVSWFKNGSRIKDMFAAGVVNGIVDSDCNETVDGGNVQGVCMSKPECAQLGGKPGGLCSLVGSCCYIKKTCGQTTNAKVSYFVHPSSFQQRCNLTVTKYSRAVCQIRLDFIDFETAPPTSDPGSTRAYRCRHDMFDVKDISRKLKFPHLCGKNAGQHMYIPVSREENHIILRFSFAKRSDSDEVLGNPKFKIKITQLECLEPVYENFLTAPSKLMTIHNNLKNKKHSRCCKDLLAPPGCLQYYTEEDGRFESFNYNGGRGPYIGGFHYAICIKRSPDTCGASYTLDNIQMSSNKDGCHLGGEASSTNSQDYIRITEGYIMDSDKKNYKDHYCNKADKNKIVTAMSYEPLYVGVHTDGFRPQTNATTDDEVGFKISYSIKTGEEECSK